MTSRIVVVSLVCLSVALGALAADTWRLPPETTKFRPGAGAPLVLANCALCHSADYISTQPPLTRDAWKATVDKMRLKYGAPIATNNVDGLADYLSLSYGARRR